jgi:signal transduction histidine kinase
MSWNERSSLVTATSTSNNEKSSLHSTMAYHIDTVVGRGRSGTIQLVVVVVDCFTREYT